MTQIKAKNLPRELDRMAQELARVILEKINKLNIDPSRVAFLYTQITERMHDLVPLATGRTVVKAKLVHPSKAKKK